MISENRGVSSQRPRVIANRAQHARVREAAAENARQRLPDLGVAESFERGDLRTADGTDRRDTRTNGAASNDHRARAALAEAAAELRTAERKLVAEHVQQRRRP